MRRIRHGAQEPLVEDCKRSSRGYTDQFWFGGPMTVGAYRDVDSEWDLHFRSAIEGVNLSICGVISMKAILRKIYCFNYGLCAYYAANLSETRNTQDCLQ